MPSVLGMHGHQPLPLGLQFLLEVMVLIEEDLHLLYPF